MNDSRQLCGPTALWLRIRPRIRRPAGRRAGGIFYAGWLATTSATARNRCTPPSITTAGRSKTIPMISRQRMEFTGGSRARSLRRASMRPMWLQCWRLSSPFPAMCSIVRRLPAPLCNVRRYRLYAFDRREASQTAARRNPARLPRKGCRGRKRTADLIYSAWVESAKPVQDRY